MRAALDLVDSGLGRANQTRNLRVFQFGMIAHQPQNRIRAILTLG